MKGLFQSIFLFGALIIAAGWGNAQAPPIELPRLVLTAQHRETVSIPGATRATQVVAIRSGNTGVAIARLYRANQVEIVAVAPGKTTVEFVDSSIRQRYVITVWVEAPNATGGGGSSYGPSDKTQLNQVVMLPKHTENVEVPGNSPRISGIKSSNKDVATARTDPPRGIQVYAEALGDTFIEFFDNATGTAYQVHVWVTATGKLPTESGSGGNGVKNTTKDPKPVKSPIIKPSGVVAVDPCVVGDWISVTIDRRKPGGSGVRVSIDKFGKTEIDYSGMQETIDGPITATASGSAIVYVQTSNKSIMLWKVIESNVNVTSRYDGGPPASIVLNDGGWGIPANGGYTCTKDTLTTAKQTFRRP